MVRRLPLLTLIAFAAPSPAMASTSGFKVASAQTENFELLIKYPEPATGETLLRVFLADYATNRPAEGATIDLEFSGPAAWQGQALATTSPGVYQLTAAFAKDGTYDALASVKVGELTDLIAVSGIEIGPASSAVPDPGASAPHFPWLWVGLVGLVAIALAAGLRRRGAA